MLNNRYFFKLIVIALFITGILLSNAKTPMGLTRSDGPLPTIFFKPPADAQEPHKTTGAGSRGGSCPQDPLLSETTAKRSLMALVPNTNTGLTLAERPTFWIYLPKTTAKQIVLSIREAGIKDHAQIYLPTPEDSGVVGFQLPATGPALEIGKTYQWAVVLICGARPSPNDPAIAAWVRRIGPVQPLKKGTILEQAAWYGEQGIWYDAIAALAEVRRTKPNDQGLTDIWTNFLNSAGLEAISTEPLQF
jgi:hypothetical protein